MQQFSSIEKVDTAILYALELASSLSVLLLAFGLIASMANVLTKGAVLTENIFMQRVWAWTQCIAIDASVAGTIIRTFRYHAEEERVKTWLYGFLSVLLLFTAAIVSNIESVQQTLNLTLDNAYIHVFVPVEALIWIRSLAIVLLIVAHALRHVHSTRAGAGIAARANNAAGARFDSNFRTCGDVTRTAGTNDRFCRDPPPAGATGASAPGDKSTAYHKGSTRGRKLRAGENLYGRTSGSESTRSCQGSFDQREYSE